MSDGVVEFERMEEDIEEYINVMEESIDVDVDKKGNRSSKGVNFKMQKKCFSTQAGKTWRKNISV